MSKHFSSEGSANTNKIIHLLKIETRGNPKVDRRGKDHGQRHHSLLCKHNININRLNLRILNLTDHCQNWDGVFA